MQRRRGRIVSRARALAACVLALGVLAPLAGGCGRTAGPASATSVTVSREALGTVVTVTAWGADERALRSGIEGAFVEMRTVADELDVYSATSTISAFNASPYEWHTLPPSAVEILGRVETLEVSDWFSPTLLGVTKLYGFGGSETVPGQELLLDATRYGSDLEREGDGARFAKVVDRIPAVPSEAPRPIPGFDFGGASKGLAMDRAMARLRETPGLTAALISTVSSTVAWGEKPDGEPWRIGIEDPRAAGSVLAVVSGEDTRTLNVSTSGDYQRYFERDGVRYHHILDPKTGQPAAGIRSLTVFGRLSGMDADILSTALFVAGKGEALAYARRAKVGVYVVDADGKASSYVPPDLKGIALTVEGEPRP